MYIYIYIYRHCPATHAQMIENGAACGRGRGRGLCFPTELILFVCLQCFPAQNAKRRKHNYNF